MLKIAEINKKAIGLWIVGFIPIKQKHLWFNWLGNLKVYNDVLNLNTANVSLCNKQKTKLHDEQTSASVKTVDIEDENSNTSTCYTMSTLPMQYRTGVLLKTSFLFQKSDYWVGNPKRRKNTNGSNYFTQNSYPSTAESNELRSIKPALFTRFKIGTLRMGRR